jgi:acyl transferase domain-containing protein/acyl carrier protein
MTEDNKIAIVGMAGRFPEAGDIQEFWKNLCEGKDCISHFSDEQLIVNGVDAQVLADSKYVKSAPVLRNTELFDASFFGITPREAELMDPQQKLFLECCWEALEMSGYDPMTSADPVGVFAGARTNTYLLSLITHQEILDSTRMFDLGLGNDLGFLSTRISHLLNLQGPSISLQTACSTSLVAVHLACQSILLGECRMALAGGVAVNVPHVAGYMYEDGSVESPDGRCRPFDAGARGTVFGSGAGVVVLKELDDALADGDLIHAVIRGSAINNDGSAKASFTAPGVRGQVRVIKEAFRNAAVAPRSVSYVECHGTGTLLGDALEVRALRKAFGAELKDSCALGSVKGNVGHLDAAAGITGLIKAVLSLKHRMLLPSLHFRKANPQIDLSGSGFYVNTTLREWESAGPRRAGVSAFGVGGTNAHVVLEEASGVTALESGRERHLLVLSARTETALKQMGSALASHLQEHKEQEMEDVAYTLQVGRHRFAWRHSFACVSREEAILELQKSSEWNEEEKEEGKPEVVFLFPGQGGQYAAMGRELYQKEAEFRRHLDECSEILHGSLGLDLNRLVSGENGQKWSGQEGETWLVQPWLMAVEYSLARLWMTWGVRPQAMLGHSLGEYTAACLSGVLDLDEALQLVATRGRLMQEGERGGMLAIPLGGDQVEEMLKGREVSVAAFNGFDHCTVAGREAAIEELEAELKANQIGCQRLRTSQAFHTGLVEPVMERFEREISKIKLRAPKLRFISNVTGDWITDEEAQDAKYWVRQMRAPVQFHKGVGRILEEMGKVLLEVGPGQGLRRLVLRHGEARRSRLILASLAAGGTGELRHILTTLGRMWESGVDVDWKEFQVGPRRRTPLPTYPFERKRFWIDPSPRHGPEPGSVSPGAIAKSLNVSEWFWAPSWKLSSASDTGPRQFTRPECWLMFIGDENLGPELANHLTQEGQTVIRVMKGPRFTCIDANCYSVDPTNPSDYQRLVDALRAKQQSIGCILHLWSLDEVGDDDSYPSLFEHVQETGLYTLLHLLQALLADNSDPSCRIWIISKHLFAIESNDSLIPAKSGLLAFSKIATQEHHKISCSVIDVLPESSPFGQSEMCVRIMRELKSGRMQPVMALRGRNKWLPHFDRLALPSDGPAVRELRTSGVYLITGGLGAVGLLVARHLVQSLNATVVLVGRTPIPPRAKWSEVLQESPASSLANKLRSVISLQEIRGNVEVLQADVCDKEQMGRIIDHCYGSFGRVDGVIHAAGVTSGRTVFCPIRDLTTEAFTIQAAPKVYGLQILREVLRGRGVPFVLAMSSNAAVLGGLGLCAYAAANSVMDTIVEQQSKEDSGTAWISSNWDHWPEETKQLKQYHTSLDSYAMSRDEALGATERIMQGSGAGRVIVATGHLRKRLQLWAPSDATRDSVLANQSNEGKSRSRPRLKTIYLQPQTETEQRLASVWEAVLGIEKIGIHDDFFELGGHSLLATRLVAQIRTALGVELPLAKLFEGPTVAEMARELEHRHEAVDV